MGTRVGVSTPARPHPMDCFQEHFTSSGRSQQLRTGLQCSPIDVNTPIRAWREVFKPTLLEKIVRYTNEYGRTHAKRWTDISKKELESFLAVLFISGIQKRKDKPANWFSTNRLLENPVMKKVMSGRKFFTILRYSHCCPLHNQDQMPSTTIQVTKWRRYKTSWKKGTSNYSFQDNSFHWMRP